MIVRRSLVTGKALPLPVADSAPLLHAKPARSKRSEGVARGNVTRKAKARAKVLEVAAGLRCELVMW